MNITLYQFPAACSRVTMNALEELGLSFNDICVNIRAAAQQGAEYLAVNPKGKVPALAIDGRVLTENAAILWTLHGLHPDGGLLPSSQDPLQRHEYLSDLTWCSGTMHPIVRQVRMPKKWTTGEFEGVREDGINKLTKECKSFAERVQGGRWWYGDAWSIIDTYIYWGYSTAAKGGFPLETFPALLDHAERVRSRPSFQRVLDRERAALERENIADVVL